MIDFITPERFWASVWSPHDIHKMTPYYLLYFISFHKFSIIIQLNVKYLLMKCIGVYVTTLIWSVIVDKYTGQCKYEIY